MKENKIKLEDISGIGPKLAAELDSMPYSLLSILKAIDTCQIKKLGPNKIKAIQEVLDKC